MKIKNLFILLAATFALTVFNVSCQKSGTEGGDTEKPEEPEEPEDPDGIDWSQIDSQATVRGVVTCDGEAYRE